MSSEETEITEFKQYRKPNKIPSNTYSNLESLVKKVDRRENNPGKLSTTKVDDIICGYSMCTIWRFDSIENKYNAYRGEDCIKNFCESLRSQSTLSNKIKIYQKT